MRILPTKLFDRTALQISSVVQFLCNAFACHGNGTVYTYTHLKVSDAFLVTLTNRLWPRTSLCRMLLRDNRNMNDLIRSNDTGTLSPSRPGVPSFFLINPTTKLRANNKSTSHLALTNFHLVVVPEACQHHFN